MALSPVKCTIKFYNQNAQAYDVYYPKTVQEQVVGYEDFFGGAKVTVTGATANTNIVATGVDPDKDNEALESQTKTADSDGKAVFYLDFGVWTFTNESKSGTLTIEEFKVLTVALA